MPTCYKIIRKMASDHGLQIDSEWIENGNIFVDGIYVDSFHTYEECGNIIFSILSKVCKNANIEMEELRMLVQSFGMKTYLDRFTIGNIKIRPSFLGFCVTEYKTEKEREIAVIGTKKFMTVIKKLYCTGKLRLPIGEIPKQIECEVVRDLFAKCKSIEIKGSCYRKGNSKITKLSDNLVSYEFWDVDNKRKEILFHF